MSSRAGLRSSARVAAAVATAQSQTVVRSASADSSSSAGSASSILDGAVAVLQAARTASPRSRARGNAGAGAARGGGNGGVGESPGRASNNAGSRGGSSRANRSGMRGGRGGSVRGGGHVARGPGGGRVTRIVVVGRWAGRGRGGRARGGVSGIARPSPSPSPEGSSSSSSSSSSDDDDDGSSRESSLGQNALYDREGEIDWRDPAIQEEIRGLDFDPRAPFSPLDVAELPMFATEPRPALPFLELEPWQVQAVGLLYPGADFLLCRLPVTDNQVLRVTGSNLARLGALTLGEHSFYTVNTANAQAVPGVAPGIGNGNGNNNTILVLPTSHFGVALVRRDWPQGRVAHLPPGEEHRAFVDRVVDTFGRIPGEYLVGSPRRDGITGAVNAMRYCRAFVPAAGRAQPDRARQLQWLNAQLGTTPQDPDTWRQMSDAYLGYATAHLAADPGGGDSLAGGGAAGAGGANGAIDDDDDDVASAAGG